MRWIVVAIVVCIVPYTWITLRHRKPGPAYLPYQDNKVRAEVSRLLDAGYRRIELPMPARMHPLDPASTETASVSESPGGLPPLLIEALIDRPQGPVTISSATAPAAIPRAAPYPVHFTATPPAGHGAGPRAVLYVRNQEVTLVPVFETADGAATPADPGDVTATVVVPGGTFKPGTYRLTLVGAQRSRSWEFAVQ